MKISIVLIAIALSVTSILKASVHVSPGDVGIFEQPFVIRSVEQSEIILPNNSAKSVVIMDDYQGKKADGMYWGHVFVDFDAMYRNRLHEKDDEFARKISQNISKSSGVKKLTFKGNIAFVDVILISTYLGGIKGLESLEVDGCTSGHSHQILLSLIKYLPDLKEVSFVNGFSDLGMMCIQEYLEDWSQIERLTLEGDISRTDTYHFLSRLPELTSLRYFNISTGDADAVEISKYLYNNIHLIEHLNHFKFTEGEGPLEFEDFTGDFM